MQAQITQANQGSTLSPLGNAVPYVLFSTQSLSVTTFTYQFFQKLSTETDADTNMQQPGNLPEGNFFQASHVGISITPPRAANPAVITNDTYQELMNFLEVSVLTLRINEIIWFQAPMVAFLGSLNFGVKPDVAGDGVQVTGISMPPRFLPLRTLESSFIPFANKVSFKWTMNVNDNTLTATNINNFKLKLMMNGQLTYQK